jgi:hypothetical protein
MFKFVHKQNIKNILKSPCYQIDNLANVTSLLWFIWNVEDDFFLNLSRVYAFKWFIMYVIQKIIIQKK